MLIRELKFNILEYIFTKDTINFLISNGYDFSRRNLHYYTIKAFQQDKIKIACDLVLNDNFDLDYSWVVSHLTKLKSTKEKFNKKMNVLSFLIYRKCPENLILKVINSGTCDLSLTDENYNTFIQLLYTKNSNYKNALNLLIEKADARVINNFNNFGLNIVNMDLEFSNYNRYSKKKYVLKIFENPNYDPIHNIDLFNKIINSYTIVDEWLNNKNDKNVENFNKILKYIYDYSPFSKKQITNLNFDFYYEVAKMNNLYLDMYQLIVKNQLKLDFVLNILKYLGLSCALDNLSLFSNNIVNLVNSINYSLFPTHQYSYQYENNKYSNSNNKYFLDYDIQLGLKYIKLNQSEINFDTNLITVLRAIESKFSIDWDSDIPKIKDIDGIKKNLTISNDLVIMEKLILNNYLKECEYFISETKNTLDKKFEFEPLDKIMEKCIEHNTNIIKLLIEKKFVHCIIKRQSYWTTYSYSTNQYRPFDTNNKVMFRYRYFYDKLVRDLETNSFQLNTKEANTNEYQYMLFKALIELINNKNLVPAERILKYIDFKIKFDKNTNLHVIELLINNKYDKILFELIQVYPSNPLYFNKLTGINLDYSVYSYCVKNNFVTPSLKIIRAFKPEELRKYLYNNIKSNEFFYNIEYGLDDFYWACYYSNSRLIYIYLANNLGKYDYTDETGKTPLMYLTINKLEDEAIKLFKTGLSSSISLDKTNKTALHYAIENGLDKLANILYNELENLLKNKN